MEASRIESILANISYEPRGVRVIGRHQDSFSSIIDHHIWGLSTAQVVCAECVTGNNLSGNEEVVLAERLGALPYMVGEFALRIDSDLLPLVHSKAIDIEHSNLNAGEMFDPLTH